MFLGISALLVILFEFVVGTVDVSLFLLGHLRCVSGRCLPLFRTVCQYFQINKTNIKTYQLFVSLHCGNYHQTRIRAPNYHMVNFLEYVASEERKRRVSNRGQERKQQKRKKKISFVSVTVKMPIGSNVAITKTRVLKRLSKNDSVLHKVCCPWQSLLILFHSRQLPPQQTSHLALVRFSM